MTIAEIYDALAARDRPYEKAVSSSRALEILDAQARAERLDPDLLELFVAERIFERAAPRL